MSRVVQFVCLSDIDFGQAGGSDHGPDRPIRGEIIRDSHERFNAVI